MLGDIAVFQHHLQDYVPPGLSPVRPAEWIRETGALDQPGESRRFRQGKMIEVLSEIDLRSFAEPADVETAAATQRDLIGVILKNLLFGELALQVKRNQCLRDL